jgi:hemolysin activation/secretion protein
LPLTLIPISANAQINPPPSLPPQPEPAEPETLPLLEEILPEIETPKPQSQPALEGVPETLFIKKIAVVGSTVFSPDEIAKVLKPYTLRRLSFVELLEAQKAITQLYLDNGYITSGAYIPPQKLQDGIATIEVIEGTVADIEIEGLDRLNSGYIRSRLNIATQAPVNREKLLNALQLLKLNPLISTVSAELAAGTKTGTSILKIRVAEADPVDFILSWDNYRAPSVGTNRRQAQLTHRNLLGFGDRFNVSYINTDGSNSLSNLSYSIPVNARNGTLDLRYSYTDSEIIEEPFNQADIKSESSIYDLAFRQPLYQTVNQDLAIGLAFSRTNSQSTVQDQPLPTTGSDSEGKTNISALRFFQEYTKRDAKQVFALRSQFSLGIDVFDATDNGSNSPDSKFLAWRGQAQYLRQFNSNLSFIWRSDLQFANEPLVPIEQFSLGGAISVRGYRQDSLLGDNGLFTSAEIRATVLRIPDWSTSLELTPFLDFGKVWNSDDLSIDTNTLLSLGLGLRLLISDRFAARLDYGIPLVDLKIDEDTLQENGVYFSLELKPF